MKIKLLTIGMCCIAPFAQAQTNDLSAALQKGLFAEEGNRDYPAAIASYQALVAQFDQNRQLAATAIFRLGECYRKLGRTNEAVAQYDRIVREFPDELTLVTLSRQNLSAINGLMKALDLRAQLVPAVSPPEVSRTASAGAASSDDEDAEIHRVQAMLQNSPDLINAPKAGANGDLTPLVQAAMQDQIRVARFLLEHRADVNLRSGNGETPLIAAAAAGHKAMVELLLDGGAAINDKRSRPAGWRSSHSAEPLTALDIALSRGYQAVAETLLARKADPNIAGGDGLTPLHRAVQKSSKEFVELLLTNGADVNARDLEDRTPLFYAVRKDIAGILLAHNAEVNAHAKNGATPLHSAAFNNNAEVIQVLLANGANINARDVEGATPLARAAGQKEATAAVNALLSGKADCNLALTSGSWLSWTPLLFAVNQGAVEVVETLLEHGANPDALIDANSYKSGNTALTLAIADVSPNAALLGVVKSLLKHKANPNLPNTSGIRPLMLAVNNRRDVEVTKALLDAGADVNAPLTREGWRALQIAAANGDKTLVETVLAYHPEVNAIGADNSTALDKARSRSGASEIVALLRAHGAVDDVPRFNRISVSRPSASASEVVFWKDTDDWNRFSLLELIAADYDFISPSGQRRGEGLPFPDLSRVAIHRPAADGTSWKSIQVNVAEILNSGDCARDVWLEWGDVVEIPEADHPLNQPWSGLSSADSKALRKCVSRTIDIVIQGATKEIQPEILPTPLAFGPPGNGPRSFLVRPVLYFSGLIRFSSDLAHVKVTRRDPATGKSREWTVDCSDNLSPGLWLRDGDVIEVPEK